MNAIVLCAGFGTRLYPLTKNTPKALLDVAGRPVLDYQIEQLLELSELSAIHVVANARFVSQFYNWQEKWLPLANERGIRMSLYNDGSLDETKRLGSVGDLAFVLRSIKGAVEKPLLVTAGDTIYRFPLRPLLDTFQGMSENLVVALPEPNRQVRQRLTVIEFDEHDRVMHLHEEPEQPSTEWICPRFYFLQPNVVSRVQEYIAEGRRADSLAQFVDHLAQIEPVRAYKLQDPHQWLDIGTKYAYAKASEVLGGHTVVEE